MANGEKDLNVGRTELTLDNHPSLLSSSSSSSLVSTESSANTIKEELLIKDPGTLVSPLSNSTNISLSKEDNVVDNEPFQKQEKKSEPILTSEVDKTDPEYYEKENVAASDIPSLSEENKVTVGENFIENHYNNDSQILEEIQSTANVSPSKTRFYHGKKLNSCLKKKPSSEDANSSKKRNVTYPEEANFVKEFIEPVDPWRDGIK